MPSSLQQNEFRFYPRRVKSIKKLESKIISKRLTLKKVAIKHGKGEFAKVKVSICNSPTEAANLCKISPKPENFVLIQFVHL